MDEDKVATPLSSSQQPTAALYSDERWMSSAEPPPNTRERDDFVMVSEAGGYPSPNSSSRMPHHRPYQLNYQTNERERTTHGQVGVASPQGQVGVASHHAFSPSFSASSPQMYRHGYNSPSILSSSTPPTPAPRAIKLKQLEEDVSRLQHEVESLQLRNNELEGQVQSMSYPGVAVVTGEGDNGSLQLRVVQLEDQNMKMKEANSKNIDRLTEKISFLEVNNISSDQTINSLKRQLMKSEDALKKRGEELEREQQERKGIEQSLASLRVEHERVDGERRILERERDRLKEEIRSSSSTDHASGAVIRSSSVSTRDAGVLRRLNNTLRDKKLLEEKLLSLDLEVNNLKASKQAVEQESNSKIRQLQEEIERVREENERMKGDELVKAEQEKQLLRQQLEGQVNDLRKTRQSLEERERELQALREDRNIVERQNREKIKQLEESADKQLCDYQAEMESFIEKKDAELDQVKGHLEKLSSENESLLLRIESLESEVETVKTDGVKAKTAILAELEVVKSDRDNAQEVRNNVVGELTALKEIKKKNETLQNALKKEAEYIMTDLEEVNAKLNVAEQERDKVTHQKDKVMNELAKRNREIQAKEDQLTQLSQQLKAKEEQMAFLDLQLKTYHSDFESERKSRETMASKVDTLTEELRKKDSEVKQLHSHLNRSAANQMKAEMEMEFLTSQEGLGQYAIPNIPPVSGPHIGPGEGHQPLRARDPERTHPPQGGPYQMHTPRQ